MLIFDIQAIDEVLITTHDRVRLGDELITLGELIITASGDVVLTRDQ